MPLDPNGVYSLPAGTLATSGQTILVNQHNPAMSDIASALSTAFYRDGRAPMTANLNFNTFKGTNLANGTNPSDAVNFSQLAVLQPLGIPQVYLGLTAPTGYVLCYGQLLSRTTYAALFAVLNTTYGVGDGSTTFGIPDMRGRASVGKDDMGGTAAGRISIAGGVMDGTILGNTGGLQTNTLTVGQLPSHTHTGVTDLQGQHNHNTTMRTRGDAGPAEAGTWAQGSTTFVGNQSTDPAGIHGHNVINNNTGNGEAHNNLQPMIITNWILRTGI